MPTISGRAWIGIGKTQEQWAFTLLLPGRVTDQSPINWSTLIPADDTTGWLAPNRGARTLAIDPAAAIPDV
jgi:hypothetical protein